MDKRFLTAFAILIIILALLFLLPLIRTTLEYQHNAKIDYSCSSDDECVIKAVGCDLCSGLKNGCTNAQSVDGICLGEQPVVCLAFTPTPTGCTCESGQCTPIF